MPPNLTQHKHTRVGSTALYLSLKPTSTLKHTDLICLSYFTDVFDSLGENWQQSILLTEGDDMINSFVEWLCSKPDTSRSHSPANTTAATATASDTSSSSNKEQSHAAGVKQRVLQDMLGGKGMDKWHPSRETVSWSSSSEGTTTTAAAGSVFWEWFVEWVVSDAGGQFFGTVDTEDRGKERVKDDAVLTFDRQTGVTFVNPFG